MRKRSRSRSSSHEYDPLDANYDSVRLKYIKISNLASEVDVQDIYQIMHNIPFTVRSFTFNKKCLNGLNNL